MWLVTRAEVGFPLFVCDREKLTDHNLNAVYPQILHLWHFIRWQCIIYACLHYCWTLAFYLAIYMGLLPCRYIKFHCLWNVRDRWSYIVCIVDRCTKLWNSYYIFIFQVRNGHIKRITDNDIQSLVLEIVGTNVRYVNILNVFNLPSKWHNSCIFLSMIWYKQNIHLASLLLQHNIHHMSSRSKENTWY